VTETRPRSDRRAIRHAATKREILDAAWRLARERGLGGWSLRDVADAVGMRAPSLYVYFASKNALFDAMFADGNQQLLERLQAL
jgi:AcrR family transcriptional regulator